jgi:phage terminase Nu1 subunit (DNA packaging protein)
MAAEVPKRLNARAVALLFGITEQRVSQLVRKGKLRKGADGLIAVEDAMTLRASQVNTELARTLGQTYSNGQGRVSPAKITPVSPGYALSDEDRAALGEEPEPQTPNYLTANNELTQLRAEKLRADVERSQLKARREAGEVVSRHEVRRAGFEAGKLIASIIQNLPAEIASIFADPTKKAEVRSHVQTRVDQVQHALFTALKDHRTDEAD